MFDENAIESRFNSVFYILFLRSCALILEPEKREKVIAAFFTNKKMVSKHF
jgi:hypothetical protein